MNNAGSLIDFGLDDEHDILQEIRRIEDRDGDWEQMVDERIEGLKAIRQYVREHGTGA